MLWENFFIKENIFFIEVNFSIHILNMLDIILFTQTTIMPVILLMILGVGGSNGPTTVSLQDNWLYGQQSFRS